MQFSLHAPTPHRRLWTRTIRLGAVASLVAATLAVVIHVVTPLPPFAIVTVLALGAFSASWHVAGLPATAGSRPARHRRPQANRPASVSIPRHRRPAPARHLSPVSDPPGGAC